MKTLALVASARQHGNGNDFAAFMLKRLAASGVVCFLPTQPGILLPPGAERKNKKSVVSAVVIAAPHHSSGAQWTPSIMADEVKWLGRKVAGFETAGLFGGLIHEAEIQRRLEFLADRTLQIARSMEL